MLVISEVRLIVERPFMGQVLTFGQDLILGQVRMLGQC